MLFATEHPDKVLSLIVADMSPKFFPPHSRAVFCRAWLHFNFDSLHSRSEAEKQLERYVSDWGYVSFCLKIFIGKQGGAWACA